MRRLSVAGSEVQTEGAQSTRGSLLVFDQITWWSSKTRVWKDQEGFVACAPWAVFGPPNSKHKCVGDVHDAAKHEPFHASVEPASHSDQDGQHDDS